jgi:hypothetical protein
MSRSRGRRGGTPHEVIQGQVQRGTSAETVRQNVGLGFSLGDLSGPDERGPLVATFTYFGEPIRVNPDMTEVDMIDFLDDAETVAKDDPRSMLMVKNAARSHVHPEDFDKFWELRRKHRQGVEQLMGTIWQIVGAVTGKASGQQSGSSDGPPATSPSSQGSSSPADDDQSDRAKYLRQIARFEAMGNGYGVAMAAQIATAAEARGVVLDDVPFSVSTA